MQSTASAPGKVILFGEHAVVYGVTAVSAALSDLRVFANVECKGFEYPTPTLEVHLHDLEEAEEGQQGKDGEASSEAKGKPVVVELSKLASALPHIQASASPEAAGSSGPNTAANPSAAAVEALRAVFPIAAASSSSSSSSSSSCLCSSPPQQQCLMAICYLVCRIFPELTLGECLPGAASLSGPPDSGSLPAPPSQVLLESFKSFRIDIKSVGLPVGAGLGSSAAFSVALAAALIQMRQKLYGDVASLQGQGYKRWGVVGGGEPTTHTHPSAWPENPFLASSHADSSSSRSGGSGGGAFLASAAAKDGAVSPPSAALSLLNAWAYAAEVVIHGAPSGLDNTTSCYGGSLKYVRTTGAFDQLGTLPQVRILLTNTKVPRSTKLLVAGVRVLYEAVPTVIKPIFDSIEAISQQFLGIVASASTAAAAAVGDINAEIGRLVTINQHLLNAIGVGHPALDSVVQISRKYGFACKLTGAGGGGCAITLLDDKAAGAGAEAGAEAGSSRTSALQAELHSLGFETFESAVAGGGVMWHR